MTGIRTAKEGCTHGRAEKTVSTRKQTDWEDMTKISLSVEGWPPKKNTAKSLFAEGHPDSLCVINLLRKVKQALGDSEWNPTERRQIGLELVMAETPDGFLAMPPTTSAASQTYCRPTELTQTCHTLGT